MFFFYVMLFIVFMLSNDFYFLTYDLLAEFYVWKILYLNNIINSNNNSYYYSV